MKICFLLLIVLLIFVSCQNEVEIHINKSAYSYDFMNGIEYKVACHMGYHEGVSQSIYLENSIPAFRKAGEMGFFACETDLELTSDGNYICMHDPTLDRTSTGFGKINSYSLAEISHFRLKYIDGSTSDQKIPTIDDFFSICKQYGMVAFVDIKGYRDANDILSIINTIQRYNMESRTCLMGTHWLIGLVRSITNIPFVVLLNETSYSYVKEIDGYDNMIVGIDYNAVTEDRVSTLHKKGVPVFSFTVNNLEEAKKLYYKGVDVIISDIINNNSIL